MYAIRSYYEQHLSEKIEQLDDDTVCGRADGSDTKFFSQWALADRGQIQRDDNGRKRMGTLTANKHLKSMPEGQKLIDLLLPQISLQRTTYPQLANHLQSYNFV